jgi:hypothetical protein
MSPNTFLGLEVVLADAEIAKLGGVTVKNRIRVGYLIRRMKAPQIITCITVRPRPA